MWAASWVACPPLACLPFLACLPADLRRTWIAIPPCRCLQADLLIVMGSSLAVHPFASLIGRLATPCCKGAAHDMPQGGGGL